MQRRDFIKLGAVSSAALLLPSQVAAATNANTVNFAGMAYFTAEQQGRWQGKAGGHLPKVEITKGIATVTTKHAMTEAHYIVKHTLFNEQMELLSETVFSLKNGDKPVSQHDLKGYQGKIYAVSLCNLHDAWVAEAVA
ncbi:desulfoferrodoxin family protein [Ferrimonas senticii]|uniref:desulfoferrodoxin family protein n=1 Tax=Ferrimonas senticii TaxID=394566 RepID=UPI00042660AD|nr:desulfoferrodoxin family protein [Ferrimonas senticii]